MQTPPCSVSQLVQRRPGRVLRDCVWPWPAPFAGRARPELPGRVPLYTESQPQSLAVRASPWLPGEASASQTGIQGDALWEARLALQADRAQMRLWQVAPSGCRSQTTCLGKVRFLGVPGAARRAL